MNGRNYKSNFRLMAEAYFKQRVFDQKVPIRFNPLEFREGYRIKLLERCWQLNYEIEAFRLCLENHWQKASLEAVPATVLQP